jgi:hypothetical protein
VAVWFSLGRLVDDISEITRYKTGIALSLYEIINHLAHTEFPKIITDSEKGVVRLQSFVAEQIFYELFHRIEYTEALFDGGALASFQVRKYLKTIEGTQQL